MRKLIHYSAVLAVVLFSTTTFYAPPAQAGPTFSTLVDYYDSGLNNVGTSWRPCSGGLQTWGTLAGEWKEVTQQRCDYPWDEYIDYYHYCNGTWVHVAYLGDTSC